METRTHTLQSILQDRVTARIEGMKSSCQATLDKIEHDGNYLNDFVVPLGKGGKMSFDANERVTARIVSAEETFTIHPHAASQFGTKLGIPAAYIRDLVAGEYWQRSLAAKILNEHSKEGVRERVLVRSVGSEIRGCLSDQYRRFASPQLYAAAIQSSAQNGAVIVDAFYDDTRSWMEFLNPQIMPIETTMNGMIHIAFGLRVSTSDFGDGALEVRAFYLQAICLNGAVGTSQMRQVHLGSRLPDNLALSEKTFRLDSETQASAVGDITRKLLSSETIREYASNIQRAAGKEVSLDDEVKKLVKLGVQKGEVDSVTSVLMANRSEDGVTGRNTLWKLSQAVSAVARNVESRRKRELEEISGSLMLRN